VSTRFSPRASLVMGPRKKRNMAQR